MQRTLRILVYAFVSLIVGLFAFRAVGFLLVPYQIDYGEGTVLSMVSLLKEFHTYFFPLSGPPFFHGVYPPTMPLLAYALSQLFGIGMLSLRLISTISILLLFYFVFRILSKIHKERIWLAALISSFIFLSEFVQEWGSLGRIEPLAALFAVLGLYLFQSEMPKAKFWAFPVFALSAFTKQNSVCAVIAVFVFQLIADRKDFLRSLCLFLGSVAILYLSLHLFTGGESTRHLFQYLGADGFQWSRGFIGFSMIREQLGALIVLNLIGLTALRKFQRQSPNIIYFYYFIFALGSTLCYGRLGANTNYFIEPVVAAVLCFGFSAAILEDLTVEWEAFAVAIRSAIFVCMALFVFVELPKAYRLPSAHRFNTSSRERLYEMVREAPGKVLLEDVTSGILGGKTFYIDPYAFIGFARTGIWDGSSVVQECKSKGFSLIVAKFRIPQLPGMKSCLKSNYEVDSHLAGFTIYVPASQPRADVEAEDTE